MGGKHPGRRVKASDAPLGALIVEQLGVAGISMQTFVRRLGVSRATVWRLLHGKIELSNTITIAELCRALELAGEGRKRFVQACEPFVRSVVEGDAARASRLRHGEEKGHPAAGVEPLARLGAFLRECLRDAHLSQKELANLVDVAPSTISRLVRGKLKATHAVDMQKLTDALCLTPLSRQRFLRLAVEAGLFTLTSRMAPARSWFMQLEKAAGLDLDSVEQEVSRLRERRNHGEVVAVYMRARELFDRLFSQPLPTSALLESPELASAKLQVGFEYSEAQAAYLGWYERAPSMIQTLDAMEHVLGYFAPKRFASEYGHLLNLRAPLYRMRPYSRETAESYRESITQFTQALDIYVPLRDEPTLKIELLRNRAHVFLLRFLLHNDGSDLERWRKDLLTTENVARGVSSAEREMFQALVAYSWGEGYKRLLSRQSLSDQERRRYLRSAHDALQEGESVFRRHPLWGGYALLARIADVQCLARENPEEALGRTPQLRVEAQRLYPSLVQKVERTEQWAMRAGEKQRG